jgi:hypothetical protein
VRSYWVLPRPVMITGNGNAGDGVVLPLPGTARCPQAVRVFRFGQPCSDAQRYGVTSLTPTFSSTAAMVMPPGNSFRQLSRKTVAYLGPHRARSATWVVRFAFRPPIGDSNLLASLP